MLQEEEASNIFTNEAQFITRKQILTIVKGF